MQLILNIILAQGNPGDALLDLIALAGILIVPGTFFVVLFWIKKGRPMSSAVLAGMVPVLLSGTAEGIVDF